MIVPIRVLTVSCVGYGGPRDFASHNQSCIATRRRKLTSVERDLPKTCLHEGTESGIWLGS